MRRRKREIRFIDNDTRNIASLSALRVDAKTCRFRQAIAAATEAELAIDALMRDKATPPSLSMGRAARARNVRGAFRIKYRSQVRRRTVVLVGDALTTGTTADACARVFRRAVARAVHVLTFARVVRSSDEAYRPEGVGQGIASGAGAGGTDTAQSAAGDNDGQS